MALCYSSSGKLIKCLRKRKNHAKQGVDRLRIVLWSIRRWVGGTIEKPHRKIELNFEGNVGLIWEKEGKEKRMDFFNTLQSSGPAYFPGACGVPGVLLGAGRMN